MWMAPKITFRTVTYLLESFLIQNSLWSGCCCLKAKSNAFHEEDGRWCMDGHLLWLWTSSVLHTNRSLRWYSALSCCKAFRLVPSPVMIPKVSTTPELGSCPARTAETNASSDVYSDYIVCIDVPVFFIVSMRPRVIYSIPFLTSPRTGAGEQMVFLSVKVKHTSELSLG